MKCVLVVCAVVLMLPVAAVAQEVTGTYANYNLELKAVEQPDGTIHEYATFEQYSTTNVQDHPLNNMKFKCWGLDVVSASDEVLSSAGACVGGNPDGDVEWTWWRMTETATEKCPAFCGVWGITNATGAVEGMIGLAGTWKTTGIFADESGAGVWELNSK
jgi:hypothetical protein